MEHFKFFSHKQREDEQFDVWYTDLKKLIKGCDFGNAENKILKIQIVLGIYDKDTQSRLLRDDVVLEKVVSYCQAVECAEDHRRVLTTTEEVDKVVHEVGSKTTWVANNQHQGDSPKKNAGNNYSNQKQWMDNKKELQPSKYCDKGYINKLITCKRCGLKHVYNNCSAYSKCCNNCNRFHHFAKMCRKKCQISESKVRKAQEVRVENKVDDNVFSIESMHKLYSIENEWCKIFRVNGKSINFKLGSGAEINTLTEIECEKLGLQNLIQKSNIVLEVYGGFKMKPIGIIKAILTLDNKDIETEFVIIDRAHSSKSIIGL